MKAEVTGNSCEIGDCQLGPSSTDAQKLPRRTIIIEQSQAEPAILDVDRMLCQIQARVVRNMRRRFTIGRGKLDRKVLRIQRQARDSLQADQPGRALAQSPAIVARHAVDKRQPQCDVIHLEPKIGCRVQRHAWPDQASALVQPQTPDLEHALAASDWISQVRVAFIGQAEVTFQGQAIKQADGAMEFDRQAQGKVIKIPPLPELTCQVAAHCACTQCVDQILRGNVVLVRDQPQVRRSLHHFEVDAVTRNQQSAGCVETSTHRAKGHDLKGIAFARLEVIDQ